MYVLCNFKAVIFIYLFIFFLILGKITDFTALFAGCLPNPVKSILWRVEWAALEAAFATSILDGRSIWPPLVVPGSAGAGRRSIARCAGTSGDCLPID